MKRLTATLINKGPLTNREAEILSYVAVGYYCPEIALRLHINVKTVSKHIENIAYKLDAHGSTEIVLVAEKMGLVKIDIIEHRYQNLLLIFLVISQLFSHDIGRRPPSTMRQATRLVRTTKQ